ncbi:hypothetical protein D9M71_341480 [compost metagenome]
MPQRDQPAEGLSAIDRGVQHLVGVVGEPLFARLDIGRDPLAFACGVGTSLVVGDTVADKLPGTVYRAVVDHRQAKRRGDVQAIGGFFRGLPVGLVEELVLGLAHDRVVGGGAQDVVQVPGMVEGGVTCCQASEEGTETFTESRPGILAVALDQGMQVAGGQGGLRSPESQVSGITLDHGDIAIVTEDAPGFEDVDDGLGGTFL